jgi:hypothetical protein
MGDKFKKGACPPHLQISQMYFASHSNFMQLVPHLILNNKDLGFSQQILLLQETKFHQFFCYGEIAIWYTVRSQDYRNKLASS